MVLMVYQWDHREGSLTLKAGGENLTVSIVLEVEKLIVPLGHNPYCIFHECADDEKTSSCWYVSTLNTSSGQRDVFFFNPNNMRSGANVPRRQLTVL